MPKTEPEANPHAGQRKKKPIDKETVVVVVSMLVVIGSMVLGLIMTSFR